MIHRVIAVFFSLVFFVGARSQAIRPTTAGDLAATQANRTEATRSLSDDDGPFFTEKYKYGSIIMKNGRVIDKIQLRINLAANETDVISSGLSTTFQKGAVKEITYNDTTENGIVFYRFKTGYPAIEKQSAGHFYQVLADGRCGFLRWIEKIVTEKTNHMDLTLRHEYRTVEEYYIYANGAMKRWKKDKESILAELADKQEQVSQFAEENKTNFKNVESLIKLINYYNSL